MIRVYFLISIFRNSHMNASYALTRLKALDKRRSFERENARRLNGQNAFGHRCFRINQNAKKGRKIDKQIHWEVESREHDEIAKGELEVPKGLRLTFQRFSEKLWFYEDCRCFLEVGVLARLRVFKCKHELGEVDINCEGFATYRPF